MADAETMLPGVTVTAEREQNTNDPIPNTGDLVVLIHTADNKCFMPDVLDGMTLETRRKGQPGKLSFKCVQDEQLIIAEGAIVQVQRSNGYKIFQGIIFSRSLDKNRVVSITAYDQLRYLKNKMQYSTTGKKASEIIKELADDFQLKTGTISDTGYVIPRFRAGDQTLFDLMQTALDMTTENTGKMYVLYDDFGALTVTDRDDMLVKILIDAETAENFGYQSTIDKDTYNRIKLYHDNKDTGMRDVWIAQDSSTMKTWGILEQTKSVNPDKPVNLPAMAQAMLKRYNRVRQSLSIKRAIGDDRIRGGSSLYIQLLVDGEMVKQRMLVEAVRHTYENSAHFMDLTLRGGVFT